MKLFIIGKITGDKDYKQKFDKVAEELTKQGHTVLNPAILPAEGFEHEQYLHITFAMIDVCEGVYVLEDWVDSAGALMETRYAADTQKSVTFQGKLQEVIVGVVNAVTAVISDLGEALKGMEAKNETKKTESETKNAD